jgi:peptidoglycan/xylan/chitin deacetylase (PgdA/CDA1 family)
LASQGSVALLFWPQLVLTAALGGRADGCLGGVPAVLMTLAMMTSRTAPYLLRALARHNMKAPSTAELTT